MTEEQGCLPDRLARAITLAGPMPVARFMAAANRQYYATRDPFGAAGDFVTAPEVSQMFGELVGLWGADLWDRAGRPAACWVEMGPGRGTLAADARRAMRQAGFAPPVHLVETSPVLREQQAAAVPDATWHDDVATLPDDAPLIVVANEFFDALPIRQLVKAGSGWRERLVACQDTLFLPIAGPAVPDEVIPPSLLDKPAGSVLEVSPAAVATMRSLAARLARQGGALLAIDYGHDGPALGDTLQAVRGHAFANPFEAPGELDLSAHVDFGTLAAAAQAAGAHAWGPVEQGEWLVRLGIDNRAAMLARAAPDRADGIAADRQRLVTGMGALFKVLAVTAPDWPAPAGLCVTPTYRDATAADAAAIDRLFRASFTATFGHLYAAADLAAFLGRFTPTAWANELATLRFRLAEADGAPVGFAKLGPLTLPVTPTGHAMELRQLYLADAAKGGGVGDVLMRWTIDTARAAGAGELFLSVYVDNTRARRFYERYGFEDVGPYVFMVGGHEDEDRLMRLVL